MPAQGLKLKAWLGVVVVSLAWIACAGARAAYIDPSIIRAKEKEVTAQLAKKHLTAEQKFASYLTAGLEFENYRSYDFSDKYYAKAIAEKVKLDKTQAYLGRVRLAKNAKNMKAAAKRLEETKSYLAAHPDFETPDVSRFVAYFDEVIHGKGFDQVVKDPTFSVDVSWREVERLIRAKKYAEARDLFNPKGLSKSPASQKVMYDLLNVLVKRRKAGALLCGPELKSHPNSGAWSLDLCDLLERFVRTGKVDDELAKRFASNVKLEDSDKQYLVDAVDDLRKGPSS